MRAGDTRKFTTPQDIRNLIAYYEKGLSLKGIGRIFNCDHSSVIYQIKKFKIQRSGNDEVMMVIKKIEERRDESKEKLRELKPKRKRIYYLKPVFPKEKNYKDYLQDQDMHIVCNMFGTYAIKHDNRKNYPASFGFSRQ